MIVKTNLQSGCVVLGSAVFHSAKEIFILVLGYD